MCVFLFWQFGGLKTDCRVQSIQSAHKDKYKHMFLFVYERALSYIFKIWCKWDYYALTLFVLN